MALSMAEAIKKARTELYDLTGLEISSTLSAVKEGKEWLVNIEVVEKHSIPDSMDLLAIYQTRLDSDGNIQEFKRTKMRKRIDIDNIEE